MMNSAHAAASPPQSLASEAPAISLRDLTVHRGKTPVLNELDLDIPGGTLVGLLGPSGCGKTTLMRAIVGVQKVDSGTVSVLGLPAGSPALRHRVGYVTQAPSIYDDLTVRQNIAYFARVQGLDSSEVARVIEATDLGSHSSALAGALSGGQRSRVSLAAALLGSPDLLVLDEPTVGLDPVLRVQLWELFHELADAGTSILVSSHVMDEATRCDRLLLMRDGAVLADDTLDGLLAATDTRDAESAFLALIERHPRHAETDGSAA